MILAGIGTHREHALASLLALNGLRVSEALNADIEDLGFERGHHILRITRKGGKGAIVPLAPRTARSVRPYIGERTTGPIFLGSYGQRMDRDAADRAVKRIARRAGVPKKISPHSLRHGFITAAHDAGVALRDVQDGVDRWIFSTDGVGFPIPDDDSAIDVPVDKHWISQGGFKHPAMFGFGAGIEQNTHKVGECVDSRELRLAIAFLARFPSAYGQAATAA